MCAIAYVDDKRCETAGELRAALGLTEVPGLNAFVPGNADCLCVVDVESAAKLARYTCGFDDFFDWDLKKMPTAFGGVPIVWDEPRA